MEEEKYSNWTEGYVRGGMLLYGGVAFGVFALYKSGQGEKKYLEMLAGVVVGLYGTNYLKRSQMF